MTWKGRGHDDVSLHDPEDDESQEVALILNGALFVTFAFLYALAVLLMPWSGSQPGFAAFYNWTAALSMVATGLSTILFCVIGRTAFVGKKPVWWRAETCGLYMMTISQMLVFASVYPM